MTFSSDFCLIKETKKNVTFWKEAKASIEQLNEKKKEKKSEQLHVIQSNKHHHQQQM